MFIILTLIIVRMQCIFKLDYSLPVTKLCLTTAGGETTMLPSHEQLNKQHTHMFQYIVDNHLVLLDIALFDM